VNENVKKYCDELVQIYDYDKDGMLSRGEFMEALDFGLLLRDKMDDFDLFVEPPSMHRTSIKTTAFRRTNF